MSPLAIACYASIAWSALHILLYVLITRHHKRLAERRLAFRRRRDRYLKSYPWS